MDLVSILAIFLLSHLPLLHSQPTCPESFQCNGMGPFSFPFYYNTTDSRCGLVQLNCTEPGGVPKVQLGQDQGPWYDVISLVGTNTIKVHDKVFQGLLDNPSCDTTLKNLSLPNYPSISFAISPLLTIFKCPTSSKVVLSYNYSRCYGYNLLYDYPINTSSSLSTNVPTDCEVIKLPVELFKDSKEASRLFPLFTAKFSLQLLLDDKCLECHSKGGQCLNDSQVFQCAYPKQDDNCLQCHNNGGQCLNDSQAFQCVYPKQDDDCLQCQNNGGQCLNDNQKFRCAYLKQGRKRKLRLILGTVIAMTSAAGIGILFTIVFCFRRKIKFIVWRKTERHHNVETFLMNYEPITPKRYSYLDVKKMTNSFKDRLGEGGYGCVYRGMLSNGTIVAVKVLNESKGNGEEFVNEVASISRTSHVNIVALLGYCFEGSKSALIYEFMPNGSLDKLIHNGSSLTERQLGLEKLHQVAVGIARGLEYLHRGCNTRILHFDIKPHNILLDEDFCPKIADFGLARLCPRKDSIISQLTARETIGYIAPEVFCRNIGGVSHKADVYSYGMMVLEMVGGRKNIKVEVDRTSELYFPDWIYEQLELDKLGLHGIMNEDESEKARKMVIVSLWCIQTDPSSRPSITRVVEMLEGSLDSLPIPPKPVLHSPSRLPANSSTIELS